jgi:hypothetical protein
MPDVCRTQWLAGNCRESIRTTGEIAFWAELASHTLPNPVFWEAQPNQTISQVLEKARQARWT